MFARLNAANTVYTMKFLTDNELNWVIMWNPNRQWNPFEINIVK